MTALTLGTVVVLALVVDALAGRRARLDIGRDLREVAFQMSDKLDRSMFERWRDIRIMAQRPLLRRPETAAQREALMALQNTYPDYAWIGITDPQGRVTAATGRLLEGQDVSARPWFVGAMSGPFVGDVHKALLLERLLDNPDPGAPLRFVDVAMPVQDEAGRLLGVVGAHLSWRWADDIRRSLIAPGEAHTETEIMVLGPDGTVLLGPESLEASKPALAGLARAGTMASGVETWPDDGRDYLTAYHAGQGFRDYPGLGWIVVVRQPLDVALAPVADLRRLILTGAVTIAAIACGVALWLAGWIARPLNRLNLAAQRAGESSAPGDVPADGSYREVRDLALALRRMIRALTEKRVALEAANAGLEARVAERTAALTAEIEERRRIERDREDLIHRLKQMAETDFLTGVMNRRSFFDVASRDLTIALHHGSPLAVVMLDLDHFKQINDRYGHGVGDEVLRSVAERCRSAIRGGDLVARMGGEEFVILLHHAAADAAAALAERLRVALAGTPVALSDGRAIPITASLGVAVAGPDDTTIDELMTRADAALYRAKAAGRNRVAAAAVGGSA
ncbi:hypothetical protein GCM10011505_28380 [Tistrella bauzanensis]|uniref:diguanylate cyclase n=1 Tax=Tistrella bauzanensis TaxID=657419 RepID=A0ABQ1INC0_9PROT|nr:sensor domain-containing diguanylate cyclase [Tistrella bauzanensis]GGB45467.1 hypothetical protein GCM10011505_28380 [Tistrella bauzanensis]